MMKRKKPNTSADMIVLIKLNSMESILYAKLIKKGTAVKRLPSGGATHPALLDDKPLRSHAKTVNMVNLMIT